MTIDLQSRGPIVECVPNFSEGKRPEIVRSIANEIGSVPGIRVLDLHIDVDHNRSVVTFIGKPEAVLEAALAGVRAASRLIDMSHHKGAHPRIGATDVVPLIPVSKIEMDECITLARKLAERIWNELEIPTYLYGYAALRDDRKRLERIRLEGFEQIRDLVAIDSDSHPDFGGPQLHPKAGATIVGARDPLIAFNIDLKSSDLKMAREIASAIRERNSGLKGLKALGIYLESRSCVQISTNITRTDLVSPYRVFEKVKEEASKRGIDILRGELVGLMPLESIISSAREAIHLDSLDAKRIIDLNL